MRIALVTSSVALAVGFVTTGCSKKAVGAPGEIFAVQVIAVEAKRQQVTESLSLIGSLAANEMVEIKAETEGIVQDILFGEGQRVEKGQLLIRLDETKIATALAEAESNFKLSQANFERAKQLFKGQLISQQEYDQVTASFDVNQAALNRRKRELKDTRICAPFAGIMGARIISPGQVIARDAVLSWLVDLDPIKVELNVPERFLSQVQVGQTLDLKVAAFPTNRFQGKVYFVAPSVDPNTRTTLVKAQIPNPRHELKPGMFANLELTVNVRENSIVIPEAAISQILEGNRANIFTIGVSNTVQMKSVKLGVRLPGQVEVLSGLNGGESVIVEGIQKVGPGAIVKVAAAEPARQNEQKGNGATSGE
jgi:membrane fusion protein (multidrug efflux system)